MGPNFRAVHLQLDEIVADARSASDEVAERIVTLGAPADGGASKVAESPRLEAYPSGLQSDSDTVSLIADRLEKAIAGMRVAIDTVDDLDLVSQDLLIEQAGKLEKLLWMVQTQEG